MENCNFYILEIPCISPVAGIPASQVRLLPIMHQFPHKAKILALWVFETLGFIIIPLFLKVGIYWVKKALKF